ncbi:hypothetical protein LCGC14_2870140 [marine sediment metagenome]|uniref:Uncharacterized protein n=1 Tax=marine sediment metagenome TaxID=412755 RepID=A0A0F8Y3E4_9ZZZZ
MNWLWKFILPDRLFRLLNRQTYDPVLLFELGKFWHAPSWNEATVGEKLNWYAQMLEDPQLTHRSMWQRRYDRMFELNAKIVALAKAFKTELAEIVWSGTYAPAYIMGGIEDYIG